MFGVLYFAQDGFAMDPLFPPPPPPPGPPATLPWALDDTIYYVYVGGSFGRRVAT